jgi:hypothetical protein
MNILQIETTRYTQEAVVDLYLDDDNGQCVSIIEYIQKSLPDDSDFEIGKYADCDQANEEENKKEVKLIIQFVFCNAFDFFL